MGTKIKQILTPAQAASAREELNLSQARVASDTGVSRPYLSQFEGGKRVLEDSKQQALLDYYEGQGWEQPVTNADDGFEGEVPYMIRDGFVVLDSINEQQLEDILSQYCDNAEKIEELKAVEVKRGSWTGKIDKDHANEIWLEIMLLASRQYTIKQLLHGQLDVGGEFVEQEESHIATIGEYGNDMFYRKFVKNEGLEFRV